MSSSRVGVGADDLVTGEAVALELPAAGLAVRAVSGAIDLLTALILLWLLSIIATVITVGTDEALLATAGLVVLVAVVVGLPTTFETLSRGRTLGKLAMGLRTVRDDAGPIAFRQALTRSLVGVVELWLLVGVPALVAGLVSAKGKRLGDYAAGTYVVRERVRMTIPPPPQMPLRLQAWAAGADIARLPDGLAMAVRQFLARAGTLSPRSRATIGAQLCAEVMPYVAPAPPPHTPAEALLAAVVAERRRRDTVRLARDAALRARLIPGDPLG